MPQVTIDSSEKINSLFTSISKNIAKPDDVWAGQMKSMEDSFNKFQLTNEQVGEILSQVHIASGQYITDIAMRAAMEANKLAIEQPEREQRILLLREQVEVAKQEAAIAKEKLGIMRIDLQIKGQELEVAKEELKIKKEGLVKIKAEVGLINEKVKTEKEMPNKVKGDIAYVKRQKDAYDDNLIVKTAEFQSSIASYAVNAGSNKTAGDVIKNFNITLAELKRRSNYDRQ